MSPRQALPDLVDLRRSGETYREALDRLAYTMIVYACRENEWSRAAVAAELGLSDEELEAELKRMS